MFWAPHYNNNVEFPEIVQRIATRLVKEMKTRLVRSGTEAIYLEKRRLKGDLIVPMIA